MLFRGAAAFALPLAVGCAATLFAAPAARAAVVATESTLYAGSEAEEAATVARAALARIPDEGRLGEIKNERLCRAVQSTYRAVVELAENRDASKVAALNLKFERASAGVRRDTARGQNKICEENCQGGDGAQCEAGCRAARRKFCGCKIVVFGCLVAECIF